MKIVRLLSRAGRQIVRNPGEALLLVRMSGWICFLSLIVKLQPLPTALGMVTVATRSTTPLGEDTENKLAAAIDSILKTKLLCFKPVCWKRAAILHRYLALNGIATRIVFGMRKEGNGTVRGHAWLEARGKPILEKALPDYTVTYTFPSTDNFDLELGLLNE
jgi:Transglutaminase-like superfamily